ncbi:probable protein phosphatase 2C 73 [Coccomyxa sp. Obi]|nr:probable protein phosphatase 2C 73 [Coccomyxa sp. Obi]
MGCAASSVVQTARFYDAWPPKNKEERVEGKRKWFSQMPYSADDNFISECMEEHRALTHLHASSSAAYEGQKTAHHRKQRSGSLHCSSAWLSRAGEDFGVRKINQDSALAIGSYSIGDALFGVFDGHGPHGHLVSQHVRNHMPDILRRHLQLCDPREALIAAFQDMQQSLERTTFNTELSGSTGLVAHLTGQRLAIGWVGDSRAVLGRAQPGGGCLAVPLTQDHKPSDERERSRILASSGRVERIQTETGEEVGPQRVWLSDAWIPGLAMSRALGDGLARRVGVISEPEVCIVDLQHNDHFLILASDGVWEFMDNQEAVNIVSSCSDDETACSKLVAAAHEKWMEQENGSADDITAVIVRFRLRRSAETSPPAEVK